MKGNEKIKRILRTMAAALAVGALVMAMAVEAPAFQPPKPSAPPKHTPKPNPKPIPKPRPPRTDVSKGSNSKTDCENKSAPKPKEVEKFTVKGVTFEMVRVEGGSFMMGSNDPEAYNDEKPVHRETVSTFYIGRTEVTQALWEAVMGDNPSRFKGANLPVGNVSWDDCQEFIERLNRLTGRKFRLPSEAEWEYAARGGNRSKGYTYSGSSDLGRVGWYGGNSSDQTHPVGQKLDNELGLYDMSGNVWEWTSDKYSSNYDSPRDGGRVYRGGGYYYSAAYCRSAYRNYTTPGNRRSCLGFRLGL